MVALSLPSGHGFEEPAPHNGLCATRRDLRVLFCVCPPSAVEALFPAAGRSLGGLFLI